MNQLGIGTMIHYLYGGSEHEAKEYIGKKIKNIKLVDDTITINFKDGINIAIFDDGQSCCEYRHIDTDDDLKYLKDGILRDIVVKNYEETEGEYGDVHEIAFLEVSTNKGSVVFQTHNEHNGYYGGFGLTIKELSAYQ